VYSLHVPSDRIAKSGVYLRFCGVYAVLLIRNLKEALRTSSRRRSGHIVLRAQESHQSGVRKPSAGQIIIRGQTTNITATLFACAQENSHCLMNAGQGKPSHPQVRPPRAAMSDYHA
jgi:hypothetical protein